MRWVDEWNRGSYVLTERGKRKINTPYTAALFRNSGKQNSPENDMLVQIQNVEGQWKEYILSKTHRNWAIQSRSDF